MNHTHTLIFTFETAARGKISIPVANVRGDITRNEILSAADCLMKFCRSRRGTRLTRFLRAIVVAREEAAE